MQASLTATAQRAVESVRRRRSLTRITDGIDSNHVLAQEHQDSLGSGVGDF
jgi:hypothetical protein